VDPIESTCVVTNSSTHHLPSPDKIEFEKARRASTVIDTPSRPTRTSVSELLHSITKPAVVSNLLQPDKVDPEKARRASAVTYTPSRPSRTFISESLHSVCKSTRTHDELKSPDKVDPEKARRASSVTHTPSRPTRTSVSESSSETFRVTASTPFLISSSPSLSKPLIPSITSSTTTSRPSERHESVTRLSATSVKTYSLEGVPLRLNDSSEETRRYHRASIMEEPSLPSSRFTKFGTINHSSPTTTKRVNISSSPVRLSMYVDNIRRASMIPHAASPSSVTSSSPCCPTISGESTLNSTDRFDLETQLLRMVRRNLGMAIDPISPKVDSDSNQHKSNVIDQKNDVVKIKSPTSLGKVRSIDKVTSSIREYVKLRKALRMAASRNDDVDDELVDTVQRVKREMYRVRNLGS